MELKKADLSEPHAWCYVNPFALLYVLCSEVLGFAKFLESCTLAAGAAMSKLVLYSDEVSAGDPLRPDEAAKSNACTGHCFNTRTGSECGRMDGLYLGF